MTAWLLSDSKGIPFDSNMYSLMDGFEDLGEEVKFYTTKDIFLENFKISKDDIFLGYCDTSRTIFRKLGVPNPASMDYLPCLDKFLHRNLQQTTIGDVLKTVESGNYFDPFFIKPANIQKLFTGKVCSKPLDIVRLNDFDKNTLVWVSSLVEFKTEFRCYVNHWNIINCIRYTGDYRLSPNWKTVDTMMETLKNEKMPVTFCLDIGVLSTGETALVEINDGFAFGNYGLAPRIYASIMKDRWYEIVGN